MPTAPGEAPPPRPRPGALRLFGAFLTVSSTTPGGGYAIIAVLERTLVRKGWMTEREFADIFALVQAVPGPVAFNVSIVAGKRLAGYPGAILGGIGTLLPPVVLVMVAATLFNLLPDNKYMAGAIKGSWAVALGFVGAITWKIISQYRTRWPWIIVCLGAAGLMAAFPALFLVWFLAIILVFYRWDTWTRR